MSTETVSDVLDLSGKVTTLFKQTPTWTAGRLQLPSWKIVPFTVKGYCCTGQPVTLRGRWVEDPKWGKQFQATEVVYTTPADLPGLKNWLEWYCDGVGPIAAQRLVDEFGLQLLELVSADPQAVAIQARLPLKTIEFIAEKWHDYTGKAATVSTLSTMGFTQHQCELIWNRFKGSSVAIIKDDPYLLLREVPGFGFKTVDELARKLGLPPTHPGRWRAAIVHTVSEANGEGSTALNQDEAIGRACGLTDMPVEQHRAGFMEQAVNAVDAKMLAVVSGPENSTHYALPASHAHENLIWKTLESSREANPHVKNPDDFDDRKPYCPECGNRRYDPACEIYGCSSCGTPLNAVWRRELRLNNRNVVLDDKQSSAVDLALRHRMVWITGAAGCGKTLVASAIAQIFKAENIDVRLAAPTGKAARRLTEIMGFPATTIHRLLGYGPEGRFAYDDSFQLPSGVVIVDEVSMVPSSLAYHLFRACGNNTSLVLIGDPNQLPPVEAGAMLRDVLDHNLAPIVRLETCHRQAGILKHNCNRILQGVIEPTATDFEGVCPWMVHSALETPERVLAGVVKLFEVYLSEWGFDPVTDVQFLTARHAGPLGTKFLNRVCQRMRQRQLGNDLPEPKPSDDDQRTVFHRGDRVINCKNLYDLGVMNGTQGIVREVAGRSIVVQFDDSEVEVEYKDDVRKHLELGYCLSVHKSQGSEYKCVVTIVPRQHAFQQTRNWLYTASTRAKQTSIIIGDSDGIRRAAQKIDDSRRQTCLSLWAKTREHQ